jgi:hypothetical protein
MELVTIHSTGHKKSQATTMAATVADERRSVMFLRMPITAPGVR